MTDSKSSWKNEELLDYFLRTVITDIYGTASRWIDGVHDAANDKNSNRLRDRLVEIQVGVVVSMLSLLDGSSGPTSWPGVKLVNGETGESLSDDLCWEFSRMEAAVVNAEETGIDE